MFPSSLFAWRGVGWSDSSLFAPMNQLFLAGDRPAAPRFTVLQENPTVPHRQSSNSPLSPASQTIFTIWTIIPFLFFSSLYWPFLPSPSTCPLDLMVHHWQPLLRVFLSSSFNWNKAVSWGHCFLHGCLKWWLLCLQYTVPWGPGAGAESSLLPITISKLPLFLYLPEAPAPLKWMSLYITSPFPFWMLLAADCLLTAHIPCAPGSHTPSHHTCLSISVDQWSLEEVLPSPRGLFANVWGFWFVF